MLNFAGEGFNCDLPEFIEGTATCCIGIDYGPSEKCAERVEIVGFLTIALLLLTVYFFIGAGIAQRYDKRKR